VDPEAKSFIVQKGYQKEFGARSVTTYIDTEVASVMAAEILRRRRDMGALYFPEKIGVRCADGALALDVT
jgi:ATP-dependent Clp protease ATP-binding subunit ClpA